jgi:hypothetical protein
MKRNVVVLAVVLSLLVVLSSTVGVVADKGSLPHDGGCVSYCARAVVHVLQGGDWWDEDNWIPLDADGDGKLETCLREVPSGTQMCHKMGPPGCPEIDEDGDGVYERCVLPKDGVGFWCRLMNGKDTHGHPH